MISQPGLSALQRSLLPCCLAPPNRSVAPHVHAPSSLCLLCLSPCPPCACACIICHCKAPANTESRALSQASSRRSCAVRRMRNRHSSAHCHRSLGVHRSRRRSRLLGRSLPGGLVPLLALLQCGGEMEGGRGSVPLTAAAAGAAAWCASRAEHRVEGAALRSPLHTSSASASFFFCARRLAGAGALRLGAAFLGVCGQAGGVARSSHDRLQAGPTAGRPNGRRPACSPRGSVQRLRSTSPNSPRPPP